MFIFAFICTWPVPLILFAIGMGVKKMPPRRQARRRGWLAGCYTFWISCCLSCEVPIGRGVRDMRQEGSEEYYLMRALGFMPCHNGSLLIFWNILVLAAWLGLLVGVTKYWQVRSATDGSVRPPTPPH
jgi:hypothetical protein